MAHRYFLVPLQLPGDAQVQYHSDFDSIEAFIRTIITSFVAFLTVLALYLYGGGSLEGMAISQMIGIVIGTISSIFVACPLLTLGFLKVTKQDLMPKAKDDAALARRP